MPRRSDSKSETTTPSSLVRYSSKDEHAALKARADKLGTSLNTAFLNGATMYLDKLEGAEPEDLSLDERVRRLERQINAEKFQGKG